MSKMQTQHERERELVQALCRGVTFSNNPIIRSLCGIIFALPHFSLTTRRYKKIVSHSAVTEREREFKRKSAAPEWAINYMQARAVEIIFDMQTLKKSFIKTRVLLFNPDPSDEFDFYCVSWWLFVLVDYLGLIEGATFVPGSEAAAVFFHQQRERIATGYYHKNREHRPASIHQRDTIGTLSDNPH
jgi:hypothetical protein